MPSVAVKATDEVKFCRRRILVALRDAMTEPNHSEKGKEVILMAYADRALACADCSNQFTFSAEDQEFHASRGYQDPKRCPSCRQARRAERGYSGGGFNRPMYDAVCANCAVQTQVPFLPRQDRPVYCSACFSKMRPDRSRMS